MLTFSLFIKKANYFTSLPQFPHLKIRIIVVPTFGVADTFY